MIVVTPAVRADLDVAASVLADAFVDDPVTSPVLGRADDRAHRRRRAHHLFLGLLSPVIDAGTVDVARRAGHDEVLGVAIWEAPEVSTRVLDLARQLPSFWRACGPDHLWFALSTKRAVDRHRPRQPHWYLQEIGVSAAARGSGIGGALLTSRLATIDEQDVGAYLESSTPRNRRLYRRHDFVDIAPVPGVPATPMAMWRPPASARSARAADVPGAVVASRTADAPGTAAA